MPNDYRTFIAPAAREELGRIPRAEALRILMRLSELEPDPYGFFASNPIPLSTRSDRRILHIGDHYAVYTVEQPKIIVWLIQPRRA